MKPPLLLALGIAFTLTAAAAADPPPAVKDGYVKVRVEVETRGVLKVADKSAVLLTRFRYFDQRDDKKEVPAAEAVPPYPIDLDFTRAPEFRELAKALDGQEVILTGLSELRSVVPPPPPPGGGTGFGVPPFGFYQPPSWSLRRSVLVTGLKSVPGKK